jgi:hypothetical protein
MAVLRLGEALVDGTSKTRICIYAFSTSAIFYRSLMDLCKAMGDDVEWSIICPQGHFRYVFKDVVPPDRLCYLYADFNEVYARCGEEEIAHALQSGEGAIVALMKDKDGYRWLDGHEQLKRAAAMHEVYRAFLERVKPDFVLFPMLEVVDGFILINLCQTMGIGVLYSTLLRVVGGSYFSSDLYETLPPYFGSYTDEELSLARTVLKNFYDKRVEHIPEHMHPLPQSLKPSWFRRLIVSEYLRRGPERLHLSEETEFNRVRRIMRRPAYKIRRWIFEITASRYFDAIDLDELPEKYILYTLHMTPEASINTIEPYYVDQLRVVDMLLLGLPSGYRLVVKEHPAMYGKRRLSFYDEVSRRPGLILLHPAVDTRRLIVGSSLVATVSGTIGMETFLLGKPCLLFGRAFFAHLCHPAPPLPQLSATINDIIASHVPASEAEKEIEIAKMLNIGGDFVIEDPWQVPHTLAPENIATARECLWRHLDRMRGAAR